MFNIKSFLQKHIKGVEEGVLNLENIVVVLRRWTDLEISKKDLEVKNGVLFIKTSPIKKNIIFIKKEEILKDLIVYNIKDLR